MKIRKWIEENILGLPSKPKRRKKKRRYYCTLAEAERHRRKGERVYYKPKCGYYIVRTIKE